MKNKIIVLGVLAALALVFGYIETLIPIPFGIPGIKLGLANIVILIAFYKFNNKQVLFLAIVKVLLSSVLFGNAASLAFGISGALFSFLAMSLSKRSNRFSIIGVSLVGGVAHNFGQLLIAVIILKSFSVFYYFAILMCSGIVTGFIVGIVGTETLKRIKNLAVEEI